MYSQGFDDDENTEEVELPAVYTTDNFVDEVEEAPAQIPSQAAIPEIVQNFLTYFHRNILDRSIYELHSIYENSFNKLTEKFYQKTSWPEPESIAYLVDDDPVFLILYRELYYRHIYSKLQPTIEDRFGSYHNYCDLFNFILNNSDEPTDLELPNQWLWDIIDEFIYQFQSFCQYRGKLKNKTEQELELLRERPDVWNVHNVLNVLYSLVQKSNINDQLLVIKNGGDMQAAAGTFGSRPLYRMLGYFSIVGLLRVHCLLGDYHLALKTMENVELNKKGLFARVTACHVTTYYYIGFSYLMMRRYSDAIKSFAHILLFVSRTKQYHTRSYQFEVIQKKSEQMYALLAICVALCPQRIDENVHTALREKFGDQLNKMQKGEESIPIFEELFTFACPKFILPTAPDLEVAINTSHEPLRHQQKIFLSEVSQQIHVPVVRSYMKLYTTMTVPKLAAFAETKEEDMRRLLVVCKHKTRQRVWISGPVESGVYGSTSDLEFIVKRDMIHITESKQGRRLGDWFIRHIHKLDDIIHNLEVKDKKGRKIPDSNVVTSSNSNNNNAAIIVS